MALNGRRVPDSSAPPDAGKSITQHGFKITTRKLPILKAEPIDEMTKRLGITPPEMIFGDNIISIEHISTGWGIQFNAFDALDKVDKTSGSMLQVAHSKEWQKTREKKHEGITEVVKPFDWSYSTDYKGTLRSSRMAFKASDKPIPLELLKQPDPIIFFDDVMLYEDEMADNGITLLSCKLRVMPARLLLLCRFFMRLDNVLVRMRDTRVYVEFATGEVIREYVAKEENYEVLRQKLAMKGQDAPAQLRDPNNLNDLLPVIGKTLEYLKAISPRQLPKSFRSFSSSSSFAQSSLSTSTSQPIPPPPLKYEPKKLPPKSAEIPVGELSTSKKLAVEARRRLPSVTETYVAYGAAENLVKECARQAAYSIPQRNEKDAAIPKTAEGEDLGVGGGWWYETLGLTPTFNTWAQITFLHMYLLTVRMRCFVPEHAPKWHQHLLDHFFYLAEDKMVTIHNVHSRAIRNKYLKDLFVQWRGCLAGYDEGLIRGDAVLATAVWRNVFKADENLDLQGLGEVVSYIRGVIKGLDGMKDEAIASGEVVFGDPGSERAGVLARSAMMASLDEPSAGEPLSIKTPPPQQ